MIRGVTILVLWLVVFVSAGSAFVGGWWSHAVMSLMIAGFLALTFEMLDLIGAVLISVVGWPWRRFMGSSPRG